MTRRESGGFGTRGLRRAGAGLTLLGAVAAREPAAFADMTKQECVEANAAGQDLVHDGKLAAARAQLQSCASPSCPARVRGDCAQRLDDVDKREPAIVFEMKDPAGDDVTDVSVAMDGAALTGKLDGRPLSLDPGEHVFVFTAEGRPPVTRKLILLERDQTRRERVLIPRAEPAAPPSVGASTSRPGPSFPSQGGGAGPAAGSAPSGMSTQEVLGLVSGAVGIVGLGVGSVFGVLTGSAWSNQKADCASATDCPNHAQALGDHSTLVTDSAVATASFIAGAALVTAGVALYFTGRRAPAGKTTGLVIAPGLGAGAGSVIVAGTF